MAVSVRGVTQGPVSPGATVAWPAGSAAGDMAWLHTGGSVSPLGPRSSGWLPVGHKSWWKILAAADLASALIVDATKVKLVVFDGASGVGRTSQQAGLRMSTSDGYLLVEAARASGATTPDPGFRLGSEWSDQIGRTQSTLGTAAVVAGQNATIPINSGVTAYGYEILPVTAPSAPALTAPAAGVRVSTADLVTFAWTHVGGGQQIYAQVELTGPMGTRTVKADGTLHAGEWSLFGPSTTVTLAAGLPAGDSTWRARTQNAGGYGPWATPSAFSVVAPPTLPTPTVSSPAGSLTPVVSAAAQTAGFGSVEQHRVIIAPAASTNPLADAIWTSDMLAGPMVSETASALAPWTSGQSLRAWVSVWQTGGASTTQQSAAFTVSWTPTSNPTVSIAAGSPPQVSIGATASGRRVEVEQRLDGVTWSPLTSRSASGAALVVWSPLLAIGRPVAVRARQAALVSGVWLWSAWVTTAVITLPPVGCYLVDDEDRAVFLEAHLSEDGPREVVQGVAAVWPMGGGVRVDRTPESGERGTMVFLVDATAELDVLGSWMSTRRVWWYVFPPEGYALSTPQRPIRMMRASPRIWSRLAQVVTLESRHVPIDWVERADNTFAAGW